MNMQLGRWKTPQPLKMLLQVGAIPVTQPLMWHISVFFFSSLLAAVPIPDSLRSRMEIAATRILGAHV